MKISTLPPHLRELARKRATKKCVDNLSLAFDWSKTREGFEFWYDVNNGKDRTIPVADPTDDMVQNIKVIMQERNMKSNEFASIIGKSSAYVSHILNYNRPISKKMADKISQVLDRVI